MALGGPDPAQLMAHSPGRKAGLLFQEEKKQRKISSCRRRGGGRPLQCHLPASPPLSPSLSSGEGAVRRRSPPPRRLLARGRGEPGSEAAALTGRPPLLSSPTTPYLLPRAASSRARLGDKPGATRPASLRAAPSRFQSNWRYPFSLSLSLSLSCCLAPPHEPASASDAADSEIFG